MFSSKFDDYRLDELIHGKIVADVDVTEPVMNVHALGKDAQAKAGNHDDSHDKSDKHTPDKHDTKSKKD